MGLILLLIFLSIQFLIASEPSCEGNIHFESSFGEVFETTQKKCSVVDIVNNRSTNPSYDLSEFLNSDQRSLCTCLEEAKFNELIVPNKRKESFNKLEYDKAIRQKLRHSLSDMVGNFTKFNNLLLTKEHPGNLLGDNDQLCNLKSLAEEIKKLKSDKNCNPPPGFFKYRLIDIFGPQSLPG